MSGNPFDPFAAPAPAASAAVSPQQQAAYGYPQQQQQQQQQPNGYPAPVAASPYPNAAPVPPTPTMQQRPNVQPIQQQQQQQQAAGFGQYAQPPPTPTHYQQPVTPTYQQQQPQQQQTFGGYGQPPQATAPAAASPYHQAAPAAASPYHQAPVPPSTPSQALVPVQHQQPYYQQSQALVPAVHQPTSQWGLQSPTPPAPAASTPRSFDPFAAPPPPPPVPPPPAPPTPVPAPVAVAPTPPTPAAYPSPANAQHQHQQPAAPPPYGGPSASGPTSPRRSHKMVDTPSTALSNPSTHNIHDSSQYGRAPTNGTTSTAIVPHKENATPTGAQSRNPYSQTIARKAPHGASPLPKAELVRKSGYVLSRISFRTIIMKKWKQAFWVQYGSHTMLWFRNKTDFDDWLNNPYHNQAQRNFLIKLAVNFVHDLYKPNVRGYQVTQCRLKPYGTKMVRQFKLERWMDYGPTIAAAFGAYDPKEVDAMREAIVECMRNTPLDGGIRATGAVRQQVPNIQVTERRSGPNGGPGGNNGYGQTPYPQSTRSQPPNMNGYGHQGGGGGAPPPSAARSVVSATDLLDDINHTGSGMGETASVPGNVALVPATNPNAAYPGAPPAPYPGAPPPPPPQQQNPYGQAPVQTPYQVAPPAYGQPPPQQQQQQQQPPSYLQQQQQQQQLNSFQQAPPQQTYPPQAPQQQYSYGQQYPTQSY